MAQAPVSACIFIALAATCFSFMSLFAKLAQTEGRLSCFTLLAVRSAIGLVMNLAATLANRMREHQTGKVATPARTGAPLTSTMASRASDNNVEQGQLFGITYRAIAWLTVRAGAGFGAILLEYAALKVLPLKVNAMIIYSSPAFIVLWAAVLLGQPVRAVVVALIAISFSGLVLEIRPWTMTDEGAAPVWAYIAAVAGTALSGLVYVSLRALADTSCLTVMNTFLTTCLVLSVSVAVPLGTFSLPRAEPQVWSFLVAVALFAYLAEVFATCGYQRAGESTGQVSVLKFLSPVFSMLWGCLLLGEQIQCLDLAGAGLILGSSAAIVLVQAKSNKADCSNPKEDNPDIANPDIANPDIANPDIANPDMEIEMDLEEGSLGKENPVEIERNPSLCLPHPGMENLPEVSRGH